MNCITLDFHAFQVIYKQHLLADFPPAEVKPLSLLEVAFKNNQYAAYALVENQQIKAYASFCWQNKDVVLLDYFAVTQEAGRGKGIGSLFIQKLISLLSAKVIILECEIPEEATDSEEKEIRQKRIAFYERNGAILTTEKIQVFGVNFQLLYLPIQPSFTTFNLATESIAIYQHTIPEREVQLL
ncbi:GNAT superfamily N-acetyltransferase [Myroides gitamensis]|uniref:GNAT family N-acetyltransferase n=1 Tax=Myroides odoratus TaxID=256 RepID=UPI0021675026|nr:GNAT family N-acetyltransferase [Myroides odoratus]MCS4239803.1 GNAT superfamily N-acetyltransferase [Myroides odoratus]MDH6600665.1 GNAT superfamily N-acetyltransferase [Myroides gitamensis]